MKTKIAQAAAILLAGLASSGLAQAGMDKAGIETSFRDTTVRPQDDFYRHVNGKWLKTAEIPADRSSAGAGGFHTRIGGQASGGEGYVGNGLKVVNRTAFSKANLLKNGTCKCRFSNWISALPDETFDHKYVYDEIGYNLKPIELQASMGLAQLDKLDTIHAKRRHNHQRLLEKFKPYEDFFHLPVATELSNPSWFAFAVTIKDRSKFTRSQITDHLETAKIQTRPYFAGNILLQPAYSNMVDINQCKAMYPVATKVMTDTFFLGTSPVISDEQIDYIGEQLDAFMKGYV